MSQTGSILENRPTATVQTIRTGGGKRQPKHQHRKPSSIIDDRPLSRAEASERIARVVDPDLMRRNHR